MIKTLKSKLTLPRLPATIERERLFSLLESIPSRKITTLVAGAGYGKTTLATQIVTLLGYNYLWYRLDQSDIDFFTFLSYLIDGFRKHYPEFGHDTFKRIQQTRSLKQEWRSVLITFLSEVDRCVDDDFIIVIDDYHLIQENPEINELTGFILERLNPLLHLIIISRTDPKIALSKYRATRELTEITEDDLRFTASEIKLIFKQLFNLSLEEQSLEILTEKTGGWVSGLILFYHTMKGKNPKEIRRLLDHSKGTNKIIASYMEENVFSQQPENIKLFLQKTSFFPHLDVRFCDEALEINNSVDILEYLEDNHLFTFPVDENRSIYHYHHLFQDFLKKRFEKNNDTEEYRKFHIKTAVLCHKKGLEENALSHYLFAQSYEKCCAILNQIGKELLKVGKFRQLESYLAAIPARCIEEEPWLLYSQARVYDLSGQPKRAIEFYKKAHKKFTKLAIKKGAGLCLNALGNAYFQTGYFHQAEKQLEEVLVSFEENDRVTLNILTHLIFISSHLGKMKKADKYFERGVNLAKQINEKGLLESLYLNQGFRCGCSGDFDKALEYARKAHVVFEDEKLHHLQAFNHHLMAWACHYLGDYDQGYDNARNGLKITQELGFLDASHAWLLMNVALNAVPLRKEQEAIDYASRSLAAFKSMENRWGQSYSLHILQLAYMATNDFQKARQMGQQSLETIDGLNLPFEEGLFSSQLANLYLETGDYQTALPLLEKARSLVVNSTLFMFQIDVWLVKYYFKTNQGDLAIKKLKECLSQNKNGSYDFFLQQEGDWLFHLLSILSEGGYKQTSIEKLINKRGFSSSDIKISTGYKPKDLTIYCFGDFKVYVGETEILPDQWSSQKAKLLLKYLIQTRARGYADKERLIEFLWPESSSSKASHRLQVTLSTLRKILNSTISEKGASDQYIKRKGNGYLLTLGETGWLDCDRFLNEIKAAEENQEMYVEHLLRAETLYGGDYMLGDPYIDAFENQREFFREKYLRVLQNLIDHFEAVSDVEKCVKYAESFLKHDPYNESLYRALMRFHAVSGNRSKIRQTYQNCVKFLDSGLDASPGPETNTLYQELIK